MAGYKIDRQLADFGEHVRGWRMVLGLTAQQVSERAGITRDTLRKIEAGEPGVGFGNVAQVLRALGVLDQAVEAVDPLGSDIGRLRAGSLSKKRAR
ncbi:MAG: helix-turn-helix domain-containing protein [Propionibacteriaceae bacterium]|jgi:transcriptional regulator with XRE-family HTH domain|nr:helix-turn-helix domain-containing protein [Propionibacteriaceae bacterium]